MLSFRSIRKREVIGRASYIHFAATRPVSGMPLKPDAMNEIDDNRYDYLRRKRYIVHEEHEQFIRPETLADMREYEVIEFYSRERIRELSQKGLIHQELKRRIDEPSPLAPRSSRRLESGMYVHGHDHGTDQQARPRRLSDTENRKDH